MDLFFGNTIMVIYRIVKHVVTSLALNFPQPSSQGMEGVDVGEDVHLALVNWKLMYIIPNFLKHFYATIGIGFLP